MHQTCSRGRRIPVKKAFVLSLAAVIVLACGVSIFAMRFTMPNDKPVPRQDRWPAGLAELASSRNRVKSYGLNFGADAYYYAGDAKAFNAFVGEYAKLKGVALLLVIHPGLGTKGRAAQTDPDTRFDWLLFIDGLDTRPEAKKTGPGQFPATMHLYLGDNIGLDDLQVPLEVEVKAGIEIDDFVSGHTAKRSLFSAEAK
jgi:hypothetical protein